jgi:hypothetical protein
MFGGRIRWINDRQSSSLPIRLEERSCTQTTATKCSSLRTASSATVIDRVACSPAHAQQRPSASRRFSIIQASKNSRIRTWRIRSDLARGVAQERVRRRHSRRSRWALRRPAVEGANPGRVEGRRGEAHPPLRLPGVVPLPPLPQRLRLGVATAPLPCPTCRATPRAASGSDSEGGMTGRQARARGQAGNRRGGVCVELQASTRPAAELATDRRVGVVVQQVGGRKWSKGKMVTKLC